MFVILSKAKDLAVCQVPHIYPRFLRGDVGGIHAAQLLIPVVQTTGSRRTFIPEASPAAAATLPVWLPLEPARG